ncbi:MAG: recombination regulator RecX [Clostridiaceae bacterium]
MNGKITKVEVQKRNKNRVNVFIDEEFAFSCSTELVYYHKIKTGEVLDLEEFKEILEKDNFIKAKETALKYIERYFRSEKQVEKKLTEKDFDNEIIKKICEFLKEYKFIDDNKLTQMYIQDNKSRFGKVKLKNNLLNKGISEELIKKYLYEVKEEESYKIASKLAEKRYLQLAKSENSNKVILKKLGEYLLRQGFNFEEIKSITSKFIKEEEEEECNEEDMLKLKTLMAKKYDSLLKKENDKFIIKKKLFEYLMRKGYKYEGIKECFDIINTETI